MKFNIKVLGTILALLLLFVIVNRQTKKDITKKDTTKKEGFGTSPGTMVQLATSHVPTEDDAYYYKYVYPKLVRKEIYNMTEYDLH
jgi:hypothetical protein